LFRLTSPILFPAPYITDLVVTKKEITMAKTKKPISGYNMKSLKLGEKRLAKFKRIAKEQDRSVTGQVRSIIKNYIDNFPEILS